MALHHDTQVKAQEEIHRVIGSGRLPRLSDKADLPYVSALVKEVMRWRPILPLSKLSFVTHASLLTFLHRSLALHGIR